MTTAPPPRPASFYAYASIVLLVAIGFIAGWYAHTLVVAQ